jgi:SNF2 family DNA or RNA helicase/polyhydroxyalkanoate synthesis regulator phasin
VNDDSRNHPAYLACIRHIIDTHRSLASRGNRTPTQQAEEDRIGKLVNSLDDTLQRRIRGLSADLQSLHSTEGVFAPDQPPGSSAATSEAVQALMWRQQWDEALEMLRQSSQTIPCAERDDLRSQCWAGLGDPEAATLFAESAESHEPAADPSDGGPLFKVGDSVVLCTTQEMGCVKKEPRMMGGEYWYHVQFVKRREEVVESNLESVHDTDEDLESLASRGQWGRLQAVRCALGIERILHSNRSTIYAYQSQLIVFQPYQYKPLLKVLDSQDLRVLIADEVGLGKTIEAGLVLTELSARRPMERVLVVCPSRLREKWRNELNGKFDQDFDILDKRSFLQAASRAHEKPGQFRLRGIMSIQAMRSEEVREALTAELGNIDMVIIDEAHHARNRQTATSEVLRELCEVGECVLLLTATPLNLKNEDLFTLLNALRPSEFRNPLIFDMLLKQYAPIHVAGKLARTQKPENLEPISELLKKAFFPPIKFSEPDPRAVQVIEDLKNSPPSTRREWVDLERQIQDLHPLGSIVTRTRKRDVVENAPVRRARTFYCDWTLEEERTYQRLVEGSGPRGWFQSGMTLGQVQRARQAASCLPAAMDSQLTTSDDDDAAELSDILPSDIPAKVDKKPLSGSRPTWSGVDSKLLGLKEILNHIWEEEPDAKVLIFTFFRGTARYLERKLSDYGWRTLRIDGDVPSEPRRPEVDLRGKNIRQFQTDPEVKVLVSTEVGSEGLDFQFCHHLINYDLPWNPMVVEQRIGRIDRFGQNSNVVHIHNLVVRGTVEDSILARLYDRIGIFERSIGNLEAILGETMSELQREFVSGKLTPEEAASRVEEAANAINRSKTELEKLEQEASELFGHEEFIRDEMKRVQNLGRYISEESILALMKTYFESNHPRVKLKKEADGIHGFRMTEELRQDIQDAARGGPTWIDRSRDGILRFTTSGTVAFQNKELDQINALHPLVKAAVKGVQQQLESPMARLGQATLRLSDCGGSSLQPGFYYLLLFAHTITSIRGRRILETVAWAQDAGAVLDPEAGELLLNLTVKHGQEWHQTSPVPPINREVWDTLKREAIIRNRQILAAEIRENRALHVRKRNALQAAHEHELRNKEKRLQTATDRGSVRILPAMLGQIEKAKSDHRMKLEKLDQNQDAHATLSEPIAVCAVLITD